MCTIHGKRAEFGKITVYILIYPLCFSKFSGVNLTVQDLLRQDARIQDLYFNIFEMKLSITSLYIISDTPKYDIIWTENSYVIDSLISEILKYGHSVLD